MPLLKSIKDKQSTKRNKADKEDQRLLSASARNAKEKEFFEQKKKREAERKAAQERIKKAQGAIASRNSGAGVGSSVNSGKGNSPVTRAAMNAPSGSDDVNRAGAGGHNRAKESDSRGQSVSTSASGSGIVAAAKAGAIAGAFAAQKAQESPATENDLPAGLDSLPIEVQKMILDSMAEASQTKEKSKYSPNIYKESVNPRGVITPAAAIPDKYLPGVSGVGTDTGTGVYSELRNSMSFKGITSDDYNLLKKFYGGDEAKARDAVLRYDRDTLRGYVDVQKDVVEYSGGEFADERNSSNSKVKELSFSDKLTLSALKWIHEDVDEAIDNEIPFLQDIKDLAKNDMIYQQKLTQEYNEDKNPYTFLRNFSNGMLSSYVDRAENLYENPDAYNWINSLSLGVLDKAKDKLDSQKEREKETNRNPTAYNILNTILWGEADTVKKAFKPEEPLSLQHIVDSGEFALKVVLLGKLIKGVNDYNKYIKSNDVEQTVNKRFYAENEEGYVAPSGGGGIADTVWAGETKITFGHGGRHLTGTGLYIDEVNKILAKDVVTKNLSVGSGGSFNITINGLLFKYTARKLSGNEIRIGTFYMLGKD